MLHRVKNDRQRLEAEDWIDAAKKALITGGIKSVSVNLIASKLGITRGSFYWHFSDRQELLDALVDDWLDTNNAALLEAIEKAGENGDPTDFDIVGNLWLEEKEFDPRYDSAMRDWARTDKKIDKVVRKTDSQRIDAFKKMFLSYGFREQEAWIRARILYYHQVGYYALNVRESTEERRKLFKLYDDVLLY